MTQTGSVAEGRLSDWISLGVLASWVPRDAVDDAVEATGRGAKRKGGKLPPHVMVYFAMALALLAEEDYEETWVRLSETLADWGCWDPSQATVTTGGLTQARQRLGHEPVREVFAQVARPVATEDTPGAFLGPWRKMSMDGLEWDVPDTEPNAAAFGYPGTGKDDPLEFYPDGSYRSVLVNPKIRGKAREKLLEAARAGEGLDPEKARYVRVIEYEVPDREGDGKDEIIALITTIVDFPDAPAAVLAQAYHERWEHQRRFPRPGR